MLPDDLKYTEEHEWLREEGDSYVIGITDFAQDQLTDIVFVELPETGKQLKKGESMLVLESVKSVADVFAPMDGEVSEVNSDLEEHPERVNESPYEKGWLVRFKPASGDSVQMLDAKGYQAFLDSQD